MDAVRKQIIDALDGKGAHAPFEEAVADFPPELRGRKPDGCPHSAWQLVEHLRIAAWDIAEFTRDGNHKSPKWPDAYWPSAQTPPDSKAWDHSVREFQRHIAEMKHLLADEKRDLTAPLPHGDGQTLLREALVIADHNSYHIGQLVLLRRLLGAWKEE